MNSETPPSETEDPDRTSRVRTQMKMLISKLVEDLCTDLEESHKSHSKLQGEVAKISREFQTLKSENKELTNRLTAQENSNRRLVKKVEKLNDKVEYLEDLVASNNNEGSKNHVREEAKNPKKPNGLGEGSVGAAVLPGVVANGKLSNQRNKTEETNGSRPTTAQNTESQSPSSSSGSGRGPVSSPNPPVFLVKKYRISDLSPRINLSPLTIENNNKPSSTIPDINSNLSSTSSNIKDNIPQNAFQHCRTTMNSLATSTSTTPRPTIISHGSLATDSLDSKVSNLIHQQQHTTALFTGIVTQQLPNSSPPLLVQSSTPGIINTLTKKVKKKRRPVRGYTFSLEKPRKKKPKKQNPEPDEQQQLSKSPECPEL